MRLFRHTCDIKRQTIVGTSHRTQLQALATGVRCLVIPMSPTAAVQNGFTISQGYDIYLAPDVDVRASDKLIALGKDFTIKGVMPYQGFGAVDHLRVTAQLEIH